ncbi:outer membrane protein OmpU [Shimia isoporae]|uniref:Outer membrane protein OmpU n=1 Tax=Shimia isoporae TaxID=647720 RepID=A0A4R1N2Q5_9RHOB|nr:porin [Shimia isoporae]TCL00671.1 outer membrane protein OmpU [Shimia isoporae]
MKNVLLASSALILTAGAAAADITFSGSARFGAIYDSSLTGSDDKLGIHNRFTLNIDAATETDSGIEFFARVRIRGENEGNGATSSSGVSAPRVGLRANGVEFAVGNIEGAIEEMPGLYDGEVGLTALGDLNAVGKTARTDDNWDSFSSAGGGANGAEVKYSANGFSTHLSHSPVSGRTALFAAYEQSNWFVSGGVQSGEVAIDDKVIVTAGATFGNYGIGAGYADNDGTSKWRLSGTAQVGSDTMLTAFVAEDDSATETLWGVGFNHGLGGARLVGGVVSDENGENQADLGVRFKF